MMELMQEVKGYNSQEEEEEQEEEIITTTTTKEEEINNNSKELLQLQHYPFSSSPSNFSLSSSSPSTSHHHNHNHDVVTHQQNQWLGFNHHSPDSSSPGLGLSTTKTTTSNFTNLKQIDFMELSLGSNTNKDSLPSSSSTNQQQQNQQQQQQQEQQEHYEKEHMFDKVVTPSDVGKLNRLVIPKQHAEKYFPLDSNSNEKGLLLNFEDRSGKLWRFRYSYWNSSQSYVMTKGWSRFVKEKKLDAGDIVSFQRGVGEFFRHRLFIDWRRRSNYNHNHHHHQYHHNIDPSSSTLFSPFFLPSNRWGGANSRFYSLPYNSPQRLNHHDPFHQMNYNYHIFPFHQHGGGNFNPQDQSSVFYMRSLAPPPPLSTSSSSSMVDHQGITLTRQQLQLQGEGNNVVSNMIIDSVPVSHYHHHQNQLGVNKSGFSSTNVGKRLRLFGVNMECGGSSSTSTSEDNNFASSSLQHLKLPHHNHEETLSTSSRFQEDSNKRGEEEEPSIIFGLDPSLQYHNYQQP